MAGDTRRVRGSHRARGVPVCRGGGARRVREFLSGEETHQGRLCRPRAKGRQLLICFAPSRRSAAEINHSRTERIVRESWERQGTTDFEPTHLLGAVIRTRSSLAIIADWTRSSASRYLGSEKAIEKVTSRTVYLPSIFDRTKWCSTPRKCNSIANRITSELNWTFSRVFKMPD